MEKPRIRHIALNVQNRDELAEFYKRVFGLEEKYRGPNGTIYLSDGHVGVALISPAPRSAFFVATPIRRPRERACCCADRWRCARSWTAPD